MLQVSDLDVFYGKLQVLWGVSLEIRAGEIVALIGANGAGKSTLLRTISGVIPPAAGCIEFMNRQIGGCKSHAIVELGISHIPEGRKLFQDMTVRENLEMGAYPKRVWKKRHAIIEAVFQMLPLLKIRQTQVVSTMSGGEQQMVAMGRGLMSKPKLCMIDEPSSGLAPLVVKEVFEIIKRLRDDGIAVFLIEQDVQQTLEIADRAYVLENGRITLSGESSGLLEEDLIKTAYLGL